ncbi:unnamed protein product [Closterium sp. NIES-65]|nr:unnamed protein product [Closterium sp. NIES-65]
MTVLYELVRSALLLCSPIWPLQLLKRFDTARVDIVERLPSPFGLVRTGVAPDHPETKNVINQFTRVAQNPRCQYFGNVVVGPLVSTSAPSSSTSALDPSLSSASPSPAAAVTLHELRQMYHAVVLAYGAEGDRDLNVPGEHLRGVFSAREFVWWYNGHPDYASLPVDLTSTDTAVVVGQGNVALDVARVLLRRPCELQPTDIAEHALEALASSRVRRVHVVGRRGPVQAACTAKEVREVLNLDDIQVTLRQEDFALTPMDEVGDKALFLGRKQLSGTVRIGGGVTFESTQKWDGEDSQRPLSIFSPFLIVPCCLLSHCYLGFSPLSLPSQSELKASRSHRRVFDLLSKAAAPPPSLSSTVTSSSSSSSSISSDRRELDFVFFRSPVAVLTGGDGKGEVNGGVGAIRLEKNVLTGDFRDGPRRAVGTGETSDLPCGWVLPCGWCCLVGGAALWVVLPCGWCCLVGGAALWVVLPCGWCCLVGGAALWVVLPCGWCCLVGGAALWVVLPCGWCCLVGGAALWSIGYRSLPIASLPFNQRSGTVPNELGRVLQASGTDPASEARYEPGLYVVGWLKRGPTGIIGTNLIDAEETVSSIAQDATASNAVPGRQLRHRSKYSWRDFAALGKFSGTLAAPMSGSQVSGGNKKDHGVIRMSIFSKDGDYNVYYNGKADLKDSGYPTTVGIFKGKKGEAGTLAFDFTADATWTNDTWNPVFPVFRQFVNHFDYSFEGIYEKASTKAAATGTLKDLIKAMFNDGAGSYYGMPCNTPWSRSDTRGQPPWGATKSAGERERLDSRQIFQGNWISVCWVSGSHGWFGAERRSDDCWSPHFRHPQV